MTGPIKIDPAPVGSRRFDRGRWFTLAVALIAAVLFHGLALGGLLWFSNQSATSKSLATSELHWIAMIAPSGPTGPLDQPAAQVSGVGPGDAPSTPDTPASTPQSVNPDLANLELAVSGASAEQVGGALAGPSIVITGESTKVPIEEPSTEAIEEPMKEPMIATAAVTSESVTTQGLAPMVAKSRTDPPGLPEAHRRDDSPHRGESVIPPDLLHRVKAALPEASRRAFDVYLGDFSLGQRVAAIDYLFESDGGYYRLRTEGRATGVMAMFYGGVLTQDSRGRVGPEGLMPERYAERRGERPARVVSFDRATGLAEADDGSTQPLQAGVQDQLSAIWQLALIARTAPAQLTVGHEFHWPIARGRRVHSMRITSLGEETLQSTHSAPLRTLHLALTSATAADDGRLDVWLATDDVMQPIRMKMASAQGLVLDQVFRAPK